MAEKKRFKLAFRSTEIHGPGGTMQRALILAVSEVPQVKGWMAAILALEQGGILQKMISKPEFDLAARKEITLMEVEDEKAAPVLYAGNAAS